MRLPIRRTKTPANRRALAGLAALFLFGALFVLPLCAALAVCTMPCCHHENGAAGAVVSAGMAQCATECGSWSATATPMAVIAVAPPNAMQRSAPLAAVVVHLPAAVSAPIAFERVEDSSHRGTNASLQVLNSVFRI